MLLASPFQPVSPQELKISNLFVTTVIIAFIIFCLVTGILIYCTLRFRARGDQDEPHQQFGIEKLELAWTAAPALLLVGLYIYTVITVNAAQPVATGNYHNDLVIVGHQWWWEIQYPGANVVTANKIHLQVGKRYLVALQSADVIHDVWIPELGGKMDNVPGQTNHMWLEADKPGTYLGQCAEYCGTEHAWMLLRAIAQPKAQYEAWLHDQQQKAATPAGGPAARGAQLFSQLSCASCHAIFGTPYHQRIGPDLTHVGSRQTLAAGRLMNTVAGMSEWLTDPQVYKPGTLMPDAQLSPTEVKELTAYLESLK
ncbi:MAG TPA: cytochrome c oxidase subunit II [Chloroflexota bacterium]|nr:cytochrome c oxidase subunit II [Chloroflexota bacterium]